MTDRPMTLSGDTNVPAMPLTDSEVNHLRRLLAWMRCEWMLDENMQRGYLLGAAESVAAGFSTPERAGEIVAERAEKINRCPAYVRQAVKMLTKALREHERAAGVVEAVATAGARENCRSPKKLQESRKTAGAE